jgi:hypothetical protein
LWLSWDLMANMGPRAEATLTNFFHSC